MEVKFFKKQTDNNKLRGYTCSFLESGRYTGKCLIIDKLIISGLVLWVVHTSEIRVEFKTAKQAKEWVKNNYKYAL